MACRLTWPQHSRPLPHRLPRDRHKPLSDANSTTAPLPVHGAAELSRLRVDAYNAELRNAEGFVGDRASKRAFQGILDDWREQVSRVGEDPLDDAASEDISKKQLDKAARRRSRSCRHGVQRRGGVRAGVRRSPGWNYGAIATMPRSARMRSSD